MTNNKLLYNPPELAPIMSMSKPTIYDLIKRGEIKSFKIGKSIKIPHTEVERFIAERMQSEQNQ